jgi:hypothetical protein
MLCYIRPIFFLLYNTIYFYYFICLFTYVYIYLFITFETGSACITQTSFKLLTLLS